MKDNIKFRKMKPNEVDSDGDMFTEECLKKLFKVDNIDKKSMKDFTLQHSVKYRYNKIRLAINDETQTEEYKTWCEYYPQMKGNKQALEKGYFYVVDDADIISVSL